MLLPYIVTSWDIGSRRGPFLSGTPKVKVATSTLGQDATWEPAQQLGWRRPGKGEWHHQLSCPDPHTCWDAAVGNREEGKLLEGGPQAFFYHQTGKPRSQSPGSLGMQSMSSSICSSESPLQFSSLKILMEEIKHVTFQSSRFSKSSCWAYMKKSSHPHKSVRRCNIHRLCTAW